MYGPTASQLYGGGPAIGSGERQGPSLKAVTQGMEAPKPDARNAPNAARSITGLTDDPAFWLVLTVAGVFALARASG